LPLIGIVDPSHYERMHDRPGRKPRWYGLEELYEISKTPNPKWSPYTYELITAAMGEFQERGDRISTSALVAADPRAEIIKRKEDFIDTLDSLYLPLKGTMVHRTMESYARPGSIAETLFSTTIDGIRVTCVPDLLTTDTVYDYKVPGDITGVPSFGYPFRHQTEQLMLNAYIARHVEEWGVFEDGKLNKDIELPFDPREFPVEHAVIVYIGPKAPKLIEYQRKTTIVTPAGASREVKRRYVWTDEKVLTEFRPRIHIFRNALDAYPEWPEPWVDPDTGTLYTAEGLWGGDASYQCPGPPLCRIPDCLARRNPSMYAWEQPTDD